MNVIHDARADKQSEAEAYAKRAGCMARGGDVSQDKKLIARAVKAHERHDHPGEPLTKPLFRSGGKVGGSEPKARSDRYAPGR